MEKNDYHYDKKDFYMVTGVSLMHFTWDFLNIIVIITGITVAKYDIIVVVFALADSV